MAIINGTNASEYIPGTGYRDIIFGNGGNDTLRGFGGDDDLYGGKGNDYLDGGPGDDNIVGGDGGNDLEGGRGFDWFIMSTRGAGFSDDWILDFEFNFDRIDVSQWGVSDFSQLKELLRTDSGGNAFLNAGYGGYDHFLTVGNVFASELISSDFIFSNAGAKSETGTASFDTLFGSRFADILDGAGGNDVLLGGIGADTLRGGTGTDRLVGGVGNDTIDGGAGRDNLSGGAGRDVFLFRSIAESSPGNYDVITDFQPDLDIINLAKIDAIAGTAGNQQFTFIGGADFTAAGQVNFSHAGGNTTIITANVNGDLAADFRVVINGIFTPIAADFVL